jgi:putative transposase
MAAKFRNKYRIESTRLKGYDYSQDGAYFITICTKRRMQTLGHIENNKIILSDIGLIVDKFWREIPAHFSSIILDEYIIMPDHIHGILIIKNHPAAIQAPNLGVSTIDTPNLGVSTKLDVPKHIGIIINQFKRICTLTNKTLGKEFGWQPRFYDHIIRDQLEMNRIRKYIRQNPEKWENN